MTQTIRNGKGHRAYRRKQAALKRRTAREAIPCWICGATIDTSLPPNHRMAFTADHYEPISTGGHLVRNELRPAHKSCNSRRGDMRDLNVELWDAS